MRSTVTIALLVLFATGCRTGIEMTSDIVPSSSPDAQYGYNPGRTGAVNESVSLPLTRIWDTDLSGASGSHAPIVSGKTIIIPTLLEGFDILDIQSGEDVGYVTTEGAILGAPAITDSVCIVPITGGLIALQAIDIHTGKLRWHAAGEPVENPVLLLREKIFTTGMFGTVSCYGLTDSTVLWKKKLPEPVLCAAAGYDTLVYVGCANGDVYALSAKSGEEVWRFPTGDAIQASPVTDGGLVMAANRSGKVVALDTFTGEVVWEKELGIPLFASPSVNSGITVVSGTDGILRAYTKANGKELWQLDIDTVPSGPALLLDNCVIAAGMDGHLFAASTKDGTILWTDKVEGRLRTAPVIHNGVICFINDNGTVYGYASK